MSRQLQNQLFNLKFTAKSLAKQSKKCESNAKKQKLKCKKAMEKGNMEVAKIMAENAIREQNQALNLLRLSARIDAMAQRVGTALTMNNISRSMSKIVGSMDKVMQTMDAEKIMTTMDKFEKQFEDLDISTQFMENSMQMQGAVTTPASEVTNLLKQVADEHDLEWDHAAPVVPKATVKEPEPVAEKSEEDLLAERLRKLQGL